MSPCVTVRHFLNLTNGLEFVSEVERVDGFLRIQSTALEQKRWTDVLADLDSTFLMYVALGDTCRVYDTSPGDDGIPRALWQGLPWVEYAIRRAWKLPAVTARVRTHNCTAYFEECWKDVPERQRKRLAYFGQYSVGVVDILPVSRHTTRDGDYPYHIALAQRKAT